MADSIEDADKALMEAIERRVDAGDLREPGLVVTDVVVIVAQRGFTPEGGVTDVCTIMPGDTPGYAVLGLLDVARLHHEQVHIDHYRGD